MFRWNCWGCREKEGLLSREDTSAVNFPVQGAWEAFQKCKLQEEKLTGANNYEYDGSKSKPYDLSSLRESGNHWYSPFADFVTTTVFRVMTEKNVYFTGKLQMSMVPGLIFARMRQAAALWRRIEKFRHLSEPAVFVFVANRQKFSWLFRATDGKRIWISCAGLFESRLTLTQQ